MFQAAIARLDGEWAILTIKNVGNQMRGCQWYPRRVHTSAPATVIRLKEETIMSDCRSLSRPCVLRRTVRPPQDEFDLAKFAVRMKSGTL